MKKYDIKNLPTKEKAEELLAEAERINPGPWIGHCRYVAIGARLIAESCPDMDAEAAYTLGLLHDIGKTQPTGRTTIGHIVEGYDYAMDRGYDILAKICVTHSCPSKSITDIYEVKESSTHEGYKMVEAFLKENEYDDYDKLIQLCDAIALAEGFTLIEKRLIDVALRHDVNVHTVPKWKAFMELKNYFEKKMGKSLYSILPGVVENTFGKA